MNFPFKKIIICLAGVRSVYFDLDIYHCMKCTDKGIFLLFVIILFRSISISRSVKNYKLSCPIIRAEITAGLNQLHAKGAH
jgi:hypothetical protein